MRINIVASKTNNRASTGDNKSKADKLKQLKSRNENRGTGQVSDWQSVQAEDLLGLIACVTLQGISISFGYTEKNGAYSISFYDWSTKDRHSEYCSPNEDVDTWIAGLWEYFRS